MIIINKYTLGRDKNIQISMLHPWHFFGDAEVQQEKEKMQLEIKWDVLLICTVQKKVVMPKTKSLQKNIRVFRALFARCMTAEAWS